METEVGAGERKGGATARPVLAGGGGLHSSVATALGTLGYPLDWHQALKTRRRENGYQESKAQPLAIKECRIRPGNPQTMGATMTELREI